MPEGGDAERLATAIAREHGLRTTGDTAARLAAASGGDRAVMTREIEKLALYLDAAPERPRELDDQALDAIGADLGDAEMSRAIDAAIDGRAADVGTELARLDEAGVSPIPVLRQLVRRLMTLAEMRAEIDAGASANEVIERTASSFANTRRRRGRCQSGPRAQISAAIQRARQAERGMMGSATAGPFSPNPRS